MWKILFTAACLIFSHIGWAAEPITEKNWYTHPDILEVRAIFQRIETAKNSGKLREDRRRFYTAYCPYEDDIRILRTDEKGTLRNYYYEGGSEDSMLRSEMYYDDNGKLRFAFVRGGAYNGTKVEYRAYYSSTGKKLWEDEKLLEGPGYTFGGADSMAINDPRGAFNASNACPEIYSIGHRVDSSELKIIAAQKFDLQSHAGKTLGPAQLFSIVVRCDGEKLKGTREALDEKEVAQQEYSFTLKVNRIFKSQATIGGNELDERVKQCIIDTYYKEVSFPSGSLLHPEIKQKIQFLSIMAKGTAPLVPLTSASSDLSPLPPIRAGM